MLSASPSRTDSSSKRFADQAAELHRSELAGARRSSAQLTSHVMRDEKGGLAIPGEYFRQSIIHAAKFEQDPRSPRKSAMDMFKAGLVVGPEACSLGVKDWDYLDKRRVQVQRNGVNRVRPAMLKGWRCNFEIEVLLPEYISRDLLLKVLNNAGRLVGIGDFRPTCGRFLVIDVAD